MRKTGLIVGVVGVVLVAAGVGLVALETRPQPKEVEVGGSVTDKSVNTKPAPVADPTAGWKTYRNEEYGFEVRYPQGWQTQSNPYYTITLISPQSIESNKNKVALGSPYLNTDITIKVKTFDQLRKDLEVQGEYIEKPFGNLRQYVEVLKRLDPTAKDLGSGILNTIRYYDIEFVEVSELYIRFYEFDSFVYEISFDRVWPSDLSADEKQILESFRIVSK